VINHQLAIAADALVETIELAERTGTLPEALLDLTPLLAAGLVHAQRDMLIWLWRD
jgi:hypothetical protein